MNNVNPTRDLGNDLLLNLIMPLDNSFLGFNLFLLRQGPDFLPGLLSSFPIYLYLVKLYVLKIERGIGVFITVCVGRIKLTYPFTGVREGGIFLPSDLKKHIL